MKKQMKKLVIIKKNQGFTLLELTVSLFLLGILSLLLMLVLETTINTSKNFLDFANYEYALMHKKIFEIYDSSEKVERIGNNIIMTLANEEDMIVFQGDSVYLEKRKTRNYYAGYILLLKKLKTYKVEQNDKLVHITIVDRSGRTRNLFLKLKDKKEDEKKENEKSDTKDSSKENEKSDSEETSTEKKKDDNDDKG